MSSVPNISYCSPWAFPLKGSPLPTSFTLTSFGVQETGVGVTRATPEPSLLPGFHLHVPLTARRPAASRWGLQLGELKPRGKEAVSTACTEGGEEQAFVSGGLGGVYGRSLSWPRSLTKGRISKSPALLLLEKGAVLGENDLPRVTQPRRRGQTGQSTELFLGRAAAQAMRVASEPQSSQASHQRH